LLFSSFFTMKTAFVAIMALGLVGYAAAECANACSGHGMCRTNDECECFPNWMASDCSQRVCPYGLSWVDTPRGDLNHDGVRSLGSDGQVIVMTSALTDWEIYPTDSSQPVFAQANEGHFYTECSNKGLCDRETGLCQCFDGYTGSSCQRTECPNDCSGHGVCRTVEEIAANGMNYKKTDSVGTENFWTGVNKNSHLTYRLWDQDKSQGCVCDAGYSGPDCSRRECPRGDDPLTHRPADCGGSVCRDEVQVHKLLDRAGATAIDWMYIRFTEWTGQTWRTDFFQFGDDTCLAATDAARADILKNQLMAIPNSVFEDITVTVDSSTPGEVDITFTFTANSGNIASLEFFSEERDQLVYNGTCNGGETDKDFHWIQGAVAQGNKEESTCSNRGLCDYTTGICKCFRGYFSDDCSMQNALAGATVAA